MDTVQAIVVDSKAAGRLVIREVERPVPAPSEALVRVEAVSLNMGDAYKIPTAEDGSRPGWDLAGIVEQPASDGSGPKIGARVVGMTGMHFGAWAQFVAVPTAWLAEIPDTVTFARAAALPTAGLTALYALEKGSFLLNRNILVTGASGGVGHFACQLALQAGAYVVGAVRRPERAKSLQALGVHHIVVGEDLSAARQFGPYDLVIDILGGNSLATALTTLLVPDGLCVNVGTMESLDVTLNLGQIFWMTGGVNLNALLLFTELEHRSGAKDLETLGRMVAEGRLHPQIDVEASWTEVVDVVQRYRDRRIGGKAILHVSH